MCGHLLTCVALFSEWTAANGRDALYVARQEKPDLILLDIMMPEMDGYDFIRAYQKEQATPIILLTAKTDEADKVLGLELGADDYVTKPFSLKELVARIHAVLRRSDRAIADSKPLIVGEVCLNKETYSVTAYGTPVHLTQSEFELLYTLMATPGRVFSRAELLFKLQGTSWEGVERTIDVHVRNLRTKLEKEPARPVLIETVFGAGYRFSVP